MNIVRTLLSLILLALLPVSCTLEPFEWDNPHDPNSDLYLPQKATLVAFPLANTEGIQLEYHLPSPVYISLFVIERRSDNGPFSRIAEIPASERRYIDTTISANVAYTYRVLSVWKKNTTPSNESQATWSLTAPSDASFFAPMSTTGVGLTWHIYLGLAHGFIVERSSDGQNFLEVLRVPGDALVAVDSTPTPGTQYAYRIRAYTSRNTSNPSNVVRVQFLQPMLHTLPPKTLSGPVKALAFSPDGRHWVSGSGSSCYTWALGTSSLILEVINPLVTAVASTGSLVAASGATRTILLRFSPLETIVISPPSPASDVAFSPDGLRVATCMGSGLAVSSIHTGIRELTLPYDSARSVAFRQDGTLIAAGAEAGLRVWNTSDGTLVRSIPIPGSNNIRVDFSADGTKIVGGGSDGMVRAWNIGSGMETGSWQTGSAIKSLTVGAGKVLTVGSSDAHVWDLASGTLDHTLPGSGLTPTTGDLSRNGRLVLVGYDDGTVRIWSLGNHWWLLP